MNLKMQGQETSSQILVDLKVSYCGYFGQFPMFEALSTDTEPRCPWTARCTKHRKDQCDSQDLLLLNCSLKTYKLGLLQKNRWFSSLLFIAFAHDTITNRNILCVHLESHRDKPEQIFVSTCLCYAKWCKAPRHRLFFSNMPKLATGMTQVSHAIK